MIKTNEGSMQFEHSLDHAVEFFSKAGSLFEKKDDKQSFYANEETALSLFQKTWIVDKVLSFKLLLWLRDCRGGAGNRSGFRSCLNWLANNDPNWVKSNIEQIPEIGRWDDLRALFSTKVEKEAAKLWATALSNQNVLAAKWADRKDIPVKHALNIYKEGDFRKLIASIRKDHIVEHKMTFDAWNNIIYHTVPSLAMARYTNAFTKHDEPRFKEYKDKLATGEEKINASVLFPHDCVRTVLNGDRAIANAQFDALPNYLENVNERIIVLADSSGSMGVQVSGSIEAIHISQGLALYCSAKIDKNNPFHKKFIGFESESEFKNWNGLSFSEAISSNNIFDGACGSTRIDRALYLILETARFFNLTNDQIPTALLIVSDMQFSQGVNTNKFNHKTHEYESNQTEIQKILIKWKTAGYKIPKIIYWNTAGYAGQPDTALSDNIAMVSGFSPSILKSIFNGDDLTPRSVMIRQLEKYKINIPNGI